MDTFSQYFDSEWATNFRNVKTRRSAASLHHNQWRPDNSQCAIRVQGRNWAEKFDLVCPQPDRVRLEFQIGGGTDCPFFGLLLRIRGDNAGQENEREVVMSVRYYSWAPNAEKGQHEGDLEGRFRIPISLSDEPPTVETSFGRRLYKVRFQPQSSMPEDFPGCGALNWPKALQYFEWRATEPVCMGFNQDISGFPQDCRSAVECFQNLAWSEQSVQAYLRGQEGITEGWRLFCAQPSPPLPTWWRYAKNPADGPKVKTLESLDDLTEYHGTRRRGKIVRGKAIVPMKPNIRFWEKREYETFIRGGLIREWHYQVDNTTRAYNRDWPCRIIPVTSIDEYGNQDAYFVTPDLESFILENGAVLDPPAEGTPVVVRIMLDPRCEPEVWNGRVVESGLHKTVVYALRPAGGGGFIIGDIYNANFGLATWVAHSTPCCGQLRGYYMER